MKRDWRLANLPLVVSLLLGLGTASGAQAPDALGRLKAEIFSVPQRHPDFDGLLRANLRLADPPLIRALRDRGIDRKADGRVRRLLQVGPGEPVRYRRVRLSCGDQVLSDADNWYVPARLTAEMNSTLDGSDTPFGTVVKPLDFQRRTLGTEVFTMAAMCSV